MSRYGIIQISDMQFGPKHVFKGPKDFARLLVDDILDCAAKFSFITSYLICSGDIAETGHTDQFHEAHDQIEKLRLGISLEKQSVLFVPGNHDINRQLSVVATELNDPRLKMDCYDKFCTRFYGDLRNLDRDIFQTVIDRRIGICFLLINSCEKESHDVHVGHVDLEKLLRTLERHEKKTTSSENLLNIAVLHHRVDSDGGELHSRVDNADNVASILIKHGFQLTLTGHIHSQITNAYSSDGDTMIFSGCGSTGVNQTQRPDGVPNQYSIHILEGSLAKPQLQSHFRAFNPNRQTKYGKGGWTIDTTYDLDFQKYEIAWSPNHVYLENKIVEDTKLNSVLNIRKNPFIVSNAEKFSDKHILRLFVQDEDRHRAALRLSGDAIIRGPRGSGKTMCLKYLDALGSLSFKESMEAKTRAECFPVLVNLGQLHIADRENLNSTYLAAEKLIVEETIAALDRAVIDVSSEEFETAVYRTKQKFNGYSNQSGSKIGHLGVAIREHLTTYFNHILLLIDEIAPVFPQHFFTTPEKGFGKWMNDIRNSGPYNTRISVYPNDVSDTLNEDRFGTIVNLNFDPRIRGEFIDFRKYARKLFDVYLKSVAVDESNPPTIHSVLDCSEGSSDSLEQLLYASNGSSRRLMRLFEKTLGFRCKEESDGSPLSKNDIFNIISEYSETLVSSYSNTEQQLAASIAKACKRASTFRFRLPHLSDSMKRLCISREETNIASIVELGTGTRATAYEFNFPYCVQAAIPTHLLNNTSRINHDRDVVNGEWIQKITSLTKENLDVFRDEERSNGTVTEIIEGCILIESLNGREFYSTDVQFELSVGDSVTFIAFEDAADDLLPAE